MNIPDSSLRVLMACLGDASRFRLVRVLRRGARCVSDLAVEVGLSQSCTTRHLQALERRGVVCGARDGKRVLYQLRFEDPALAPLLAWALDAEDGGSGSPRAAPTRARHARSGSPEARGARADHPPAAVATSPSSAAEPAGESPAREDARANQEGPPPEQPPARPSRHPVLEDYLL